MFRTPRSMVIDLLSRAGTAQGSGGIGYSGTPLPCKLGIRAGFAVHVKDAPPDYLKLLEPLPEGVTFVSRISSTTDLVHVFSARKSELTELLRTCRSTLRPMAVLWVSWPKKSAMVPTDITEDTVCELALALGFVDVKVCAVTGVWSGLKLVVRRELRGLRRASSWPTTSRTSHSLLTGRSSET